MPKNTPARIIDERIRTGAAFVGGGGSGGGGVTDHGMLSGLTDDDHLQYLTDARGDARYVPLGRQVATAAGSGLQGGGNLYATVSLSLAASVAGAGLALDTGVLSVNPGEGLEIETDAIGLASSVAGAGLGYSAGVLSVGAGTLISVAANDVGLADGAAWQFAATNAAGTPFYRNVSALAGDGMTSTDGVLDVVAGAGLTVSANAVALTTPGTLAVSSTNAASGNHTHAITTDSDPDATAAILATTAAGLLTLRNGAFRQAAQSQAVFASGFAGSGWRVDYGITEASKASAEFDNLTVRGQMHVYELLIQQIRATNGSLFVSSASRVVSLTGEFDPLWLVNGQQLTFNGQAANFSATIYQIATADSGDTGRELYHGFLYGDIIRSQRVEWDGSTYDIVSQSNMEVTGVTDLFNYQATLVSGSQPAAGDDYVRLGNSSDTARQGAVYLTADDSAAPFIDIIDGVRTHADWNSAAVKRTRVGKLTGISDVDFGGPLDGYGLYATRAFIKGKIVVTGGSLGGLAAADVNQNTTTIDGGKITANSVTANQIAANTITTTQINFSPVLTGNVVASINATTEGLKISAGLIQIDGTTTFTAGYDPTSKITAGNAAADVNNNVTTISGGKITTGTITADKITVTDLSAFNATIGAWSIAANYLGSTGIRMYSGDSYVARFELGDGTAARTAGMKSYGTGSAADTAFWAGSAYDNTLNAKTRITYGGTLYSTDAIFGTLKIDTSGAFVDVQNTYSIDYGYKFRYGGATLGGGLVAMYSSGADAKLWLLNNTTSDGALVDSNVNSAVTVRGTAGSAKASTIDIRAERIVSGAAKFTGLSLLNSSSARKATIHADTLVIAPEAGGEYTIWHSGNDTDDSGLNADTVDGKEAADFAWLGSNNTFSYVTTFVGAVQCNNHIRLSPLGAAPAYQNGYALIFLLDAGSNAYQLRAKIRSLDGAKQIDAQLATT
jgi:hypothetical protein